MKLIGTIKRTIFQQDNYVCLDVSSLNGESTQVSGNVGPFSRAYLGMKGLPLTFIGEHFNHPKYGKQFKMRLIYLGDEILPSQYIELLSSPFSKRSYIADQLSGFECWRSEAFKRLKDSCLEMYSKAVAFSHLQNITRHVTWGKLAKKVGHNSHINGPRLEIAFVDTPVSDLKTLLSDPYELAIQRIIDFKTAETVSAGVGPSKNRDVAAALEVINKEIAKTGSTYIEAGTLLKGLKKLAGISDIPDSTYIDVFDIDGIDCVQSTYYRSVEKVIAKEINRISDNRNKLPIDTNTILKNFSKNGFTPTKCQLGATKLLENYISVITGLPGTGKTTIVRGLVETLSDNNADFLLVSPTGTSAMRMGQVTGHEANTIHTVLGFNPSTGQFIRNKEYPLDTDWVILDEASMVDIHLAKALLEAIPDNARLTIFGDIDQIASIREGAVIRDLFHSLPSIRMTETKRFDKDGIIKFCHSICEGKVLYSNLNGIKINISDDEAQLESWVLSAVDNILNVSKRFGFNKVQILAPQYAGKAGIDSINEYCRRKLYGDISPVEINVKNKVYRYHVGSKILIKSNMPEHAIFNGDIGYIKAFPGKEKEAFVKVEIRGREITLNLSEAKHMIPGYCISIHNAQGQEYPYCLTVITNKGAALLSRNLINSAVSRGQKGVIIVTEKGALEKSAARSDSDRKTRLRHFLNETKRIEDVPELTNV